MIFEITLETMIVFFLILAVGFVAATLGIISKDYLPNFASLITKVLLPVLMFYATYAGVTADDVVENLPMIGLAAGFYAIITAVTFALSKILRLPHDKDRVFMFCFIFGNTGFVGIPLLSALFPDVGLLYMALFSVVDQVIFWTFGVWLATARDRESHSHLRDLLSPNIIALVLALVCVFADIQFPAVVDKTLETIKNATSAMCMMYLGAMLCFSNWKAVIKRPELYVGIFVKMLVVPIVIGKLLALTPLAPDLVASITMIAALPVMTVVPMIAEKHGHEGDYAAGITAVTLAVCVATMPFVAFAAL